MKRSTVLVAAIAMVATGAACADRGASAIAPRESVPVVTAPPLQPPATAETFEDTQVYSGSTMDR